MFRWWLVGFLFIGIGIAILWLLVDILKFSLFWGSVIGAEIGTLLRFFVNDHWVFGHTRPTWKRLWQYHGANGSGFVIWWSVTNFLPRFGIHYLLASIAGMAASMSWSLLTNFLWIWRGKPSPSAAKPSIEVFSDPRRN
jgi:putative flippase GtrA